MKISLLCGLGAPKDGNGLVELADKLDHLGHITYIHSWDSPPVDDCNAIICHSYGATTALEWLRSSPRGKTNLIFIIDGVKKPWGFGSWTEWNVPWYVDNAVAFYRGAILPPWSSKLLGPQVPSFGVSRRNIYVNHRHSDMPKNPIVQNYIIDRIRLLTEARA